MEAAQMYPSTDFVARPPLKQSQDGQGGHSLPLSDAWSLRVAFVISDPLHCTSPVALTPLAM